MLAVVGHVAGRLFTVQEKVACFHVPTSAAGKEADCFVNVPVPPEPSAPMGTVTVIVLPEIL